MNHTEMWARARSGERNVLDQLGATLHRLALRAATSLRLGRDECHDLAQDVTASILQRISDRPSPKNLRAFVWFQAWSKARAVRRQRGRFRTNPDWDADRLEDRSSKAPWRQLARDEERRSLCSCIDQLPHQQSMCVRRRFQMGESLREIAQATGVSHVTVIRRLAAAMSSLEVCLTAKGVSLH